jgi:ketosteroid isomerase-like protein
MSRIALLIAVTAALCAGCMNSKHADTDTTAAPDEKAAVESTTAAFHQALRVNDSATFYSHVDDDVVMAPPGEPPVKGISALRAWYSGFLGQYQTSSLKLNDKEVFVGKGWATEVGSYEWGLKPTKGGAEVTDRGHYMQVWKKTANGQWKFYREIWNSTSPPA